MFRGLFIIILFIVFSSGSCDSPQNLKPREVEVKESAGVNKESIKSFYFNKSMKFMSVLPSNYDEIDSFPVMYLLHNHGNDYTVFNDSIPNLEDLADSLQMVLICINGGIGWYIDSPKKTNWKYETFIMNELIPFVNSNYKVYKNGKKTGITGFSMGGYGAVYLGFRHPNSFSYVGSVGGCMDFYDFPKPLMLYDELATKSGTKS